MKRVRRRGSTVTATEQEVRRKRKGGLANLESQEAEDITDNVAMAEHNPKAQIEVELEGNDEQEVDFKEMSAQLLKQLENRKSGLSYIERSIKIRRREFCCSCEMETVVSKKAYCCVYHHKRCALCLVMAQSNKNQQ